MFLNTMRLAAFAALMSFQYQAWSNQPADESKLPIQIEANQLEAQDQSGITIYSGDVVANQGSMTLKGDRIEIQHPERQLQIITANGQPATFRRFEPQEQAWINGRADTIIYYAQERKVHLIGKAYLEQEGAHDIQGPKLIYDLDALTLNAGSTEQETGRIIMTITPKEDNE